MLGGPWKLETPSTCLARGGHVPLRAPAPRAVQPWSPAHARSAGCALFQVSQACVSCLATPVVTRSPAPPARASRKLPIRELSSGPEGFCLWCGVVSDGSTAAGTSGRGSGLYVHERSADCDLVTMAGSQPLALQLEQLLNPRPREADPEADPEEGEA